METIYPSLKEQVAVSTFFMKSPVAKIKTESPIYTIYIILSVSIVSKNWIIANKP